MSDDESQAERQRTVTSTSRSLLSEIKRDEGSAWEQLVELYAPLVYHWCRRMQLPAQDAADVFQEVFQSVAQNIAGFRKQPARGTFRGWLRTITRNKVYDHFRKHNKEPHAAGGSEAAGWFAELPEVPPTSDGESTAADDDDDALAENTVFRRALESIRSAFHANTWQAFWRMAVDGRTAKETADELGMSPGAVRVAKSRVLNRLRRELGDLLD